MSATFAYAERILGGRTFRLLTIFPTLDEEEPLRCECRSFNIDQAPQYEALSYVWGAPTPRANIWCNGQYIEVGPSLSQALRRLRYREAERIIWADAICINQADDAEKSHQVPMMGSIYSLARRVVVWLGHGEAQQTQLSFETSKTIADACHDYDRRHNITTDYAAKHEDAELPEGLLRPLVLSSLKELYDRPWFSRIWCIQEIRLATDAQIIWGGDEISWSDLALSASYLFDKSNRTGQEKGGDTDVSVLRQIEAQSADMLRDKSMYHLLDALDHFRMFEASNNRDKVYGLLNIVSPRCEVDALGVDYAKSIGEVYADTVLAVIRLYSRLTAFAHITHPVDYEGPGLDDYENPEEYPGYSEYRSWAPRWDDIAVAQKLGVEDDCPWSACGQHVTASTVAHPSQPTYLCLKGVVYGKVLECGDVMDYHNRKLLEFANHPKHADDDGVIGGDTPDTRASIHNPIKIHPIIQAVADTGKESSSERFIRTLTAGCWGRTSEHVQCLDRRDQARFYRAGWEFLLRLTLSLELGDEIRYTRDAGVSQFQVDTLSACEQRRLFWTERGSYGLGPHCMWPGDIVVVLYGGNTPYVLRPRRDEYVFMGQAYVDEIMNGEIFQGPAVDIPEEQTFCLI